MQDVTAENRFTLETDIALAPKPSLITANVKSSSDQQNKRGKLLSQRSDNYGHFTFKPQVSVASAKIAENLGTTFMARQEMHLEKQKKLLEKNALHFRSPGRLSPVMTKRKQSKEKPSSNKQPIMEQPTSWSTPQIETPPVGSLPPVAQSSPSTSSLNPLRNSSNAKTANAHLQDGMFLRRQKTHLPKTQTLLHLRRATHPQGPGEEAPLSSDIGTPPGPTAVPTLTRSKTVIGKLNTINTERIKLAKLAAEKAIKSKKIFSIQGPYPVVRECLRRRGWVEKHFRSLPPHVCKRKQRGSSSGDSDNDSGDSDSDDDIDDYGDGREDEEDLEDTNSTYGIMSRIVRNTTPSFMWTCRRDSINYKFLRGNAVVNHYAKNGSFTTKVGLCVNLRNLHWFADADSQEFFPRCYKLSMDEEKMAFIDDFRISAATGFLKWVVIKQTGEPKGAIEDDDDDDDEPEESPRAQPGPNVILEEREEKDANNNPAGQEDLNSGPNNPSCNNLDSKQNSSDGPPRSLSRATNNNNGRRSKARKKSGGIIPMAVLETAMEALNEWLAFKDNEDIDYSDSKATNITEAMWENLTQNFYRLIHEDAIVQYTMAHYHQCENLLNRVRAQNPQLYMEGLSNIWIIKPGAKSRGRGIMIMDRLDDITKLVNHSVKKEGKYVVQKYIERPLLIYKTKFDIRQWFLVTDWNPLTIWFYQDSYLRFCSTKFDLENFEEKVHLSNFAVQKHYLKENRSHKLPEDNMWTSDQFLDYLEAKGHGSVWQEKIYPAMKQHIIWSLQSAQDFVEYRKHSFELFGADFMLSDDLQPWLIEINCSPALGASTEITEKMCYDVIEDTMKVVLDRKHDKNCDTGRFELACKMPQVLVPTYVGMNLSIEGTPVKKPAYIARQQQKAAAAAAAASGSNPSPRPTDLPPPYTKLHRQPSRLAIPNIPPPPDKLLSRRTRLESTSITEEGGDYGHPSSSVHVNTEEIRQKLAETIESTMLAQHRVRDRKLKERMEMMKTEISKLAQIVNGGTVDGPWGRSCSLCGAGNGLRLDPGHSNTPTNCCRCGCDSLVTPDPGPGQGLLPETWPRPNSKTASVTYTMVQADAVKISPPHGGVKVKVATAAFPTRKKKKPKQSGAPPLAKYSSNAKMQAIQPYSVPLSLLTVAGGAK